jgi:carbonic anhydrase
LQTEAAGERFTKPSVDISVDLLIDYTRLAGRRWTSSVGGIPMANALDEVLAANQTYAAEFGERGRLPLPPARRFAICMDARLDPAKFAGLKEGDAHVIRNAGGRASDDAIRSLIISHKLLGTNEWFVIYHTNCVMETFTDEVMRSLLRQKPRHREA